MVLLGPNCASSLSQKMPGMKMMMSWKRKCPCRITPPEITRIHSLRAAPRLYAPKGMLSLRLPPTDGACSKRTPGSPEPFPQTNVDRHDDWLDVMGSPP